MLAILPFENIGSAPEQEHFADGMTLETITVLGRASPEELDVMAVRARDAELSAGEIGRRHDADFALEGAVWRQDDLVRITVTLTDTRDLTVVWTDKFERQLDDIFALQSDVALRIADSLSVQLLPGTRASGMAYEPSPRAYEAYLLGRSWAHKGTDVGWRKAIDYYDEAIVLDPKFALAHASLAHTHVGRAVWGSEPAAVAASAARMAADEALRLDPELAEAHSARATIRIIFDWDWSGAERSFQHALALNPSDGEAYHFYGHYLDAIDRDDEALEALSEAVRLDPLSAIHRCCLALTHINRGELDRARGQVERSLEIEPDGAFVHWTAAYVNHLGGDREDAVRGWEKAVELSERKVRFLLSALGYGYAMEGNEEEALEIASELEGWGARNIHTASHRALIYAGLGELDRSFELLEEAFRNREFLVLELMLNPGVESLRQDPRFEDLLRRMGLKR